MSWRTHPHLYEISAWPWLERLSRASDAQVTLATVPAAEWDRLAHLGLDAVYLMGVWKRSAIGRLMARTDPALLDEYDAALPGWSMHDVPGSPYCIQAYEPDDRIGGWRGLDAARTALRDRGIALVLDFVPNHTGFDHEWVRTKPERYVQGTLDDYRRAPTEFRPIEAGDTLHFIACGRDPFFAPWRDVAQLNYFNPDTRAAMIDVLRTIAQHCDGVRCDMAMLVLNDVFQQTWSSKVDLQWGVPADEFWPVATSTVPSMTYLAEVYWDREYQLQQQGFSFTYDKRLLDRLHDGAGDPIRGHLRADPAFAARLVRFLENHDEPRAASVFESRLTAAAATAFTLPGMRFLFDGQIDGAHVRPPVQLGKWPQEPPAPHVRDMYERLLHVANLPLLHEGSWQLLDVRSCGDDTAGNLVAFSWRRNADCAVVVANISVHESQGLVQPDTLPDGDPLVFHDELSDHSYTWSRADLRNGLYVRLAGGSAHMFLVSAISDPPPPSSWPPQTSADRTRLGTRRS